MSLPKGIVILFGGDVPTCYPLAPAATNSNESRNLYRPLIAI